MNIFLRTLKTVLMALILAVYAFPLASCGGEDEPDTPSTAQQTVLMYMPWAGSDIYSYFINNINAFKENIVENGGLDGRRLLVFISQNASGSSLIEITYRNKQCVQDTLKSYTFSSLDFTTSAGIAEIINDAKQAAPANAYSMIIGCHGMGWLPVSTKTAALVRQSRSAVKNRPLTRYFGHSSDSKYQTDISTLAEGIANTGLKMKYIVFDDCYMSNVETAYELRNVTDYLVASTCEVMIEGIPYNKVGTYLLHNDLQNVCAGFYEFYSTYSTPCGTIGVTDCSQVESMAQIMKTINTMYPEGLSSTEDVQTLDGYSPTIFFDFGDYVDKLCEDETLKKTFNSQLQLLVPYKANTPTYYSMFISGSGRRTINAFSGLTVSDPSVNTRYGVKTSKTQTAWYEATH